MRTGRSDWGVACWENNRQRIFSGEFSSALGHAAEIIHESRVKQDNLKWLDLSNNHLELLSGKAIGKMLEKCVELEVLILAWNDLYPDKGGWECVLTLISLVYLDDLSQGAVCWWKVWWKMLVCWKWICRGIISQAQQSPMGLKKWSQNTPPWPRFTWKTTSGYSAGAFNGAAF